MVGADIDTLDRIKAITADVDLDDGICMSIIPDALASMFLKSEDKDLSNYFSSSYREKLSKYMELFRPVAKFETKEDVYDSSMRVGD